MESTIPYIDPNVEHVGVSRLRSLNATNLKEISKTLVFQENDKPLAVLLKYEQFLTMQNQLTSLLDTIELVTDKEELKALFDGLRDAEAGRTKTLSEIRAAYRRKRR